MTSTPVHPVFYDPRRRRQRIVWLLALLASVGGTLFCASLLVTPFLPAIRLPHPALLDNLDLGNPAMARREVVERRVVLRRMKQELARLSPGGRGAAPAPVLPAASRPVVAA